MRPVDISDESPSPPQAGITRRDCLAPPAAVLAVSLAGLPLGEANAAQSPEKLFPGEQILNGAGFPRLAKFQRGDSAKPLILGVPGGGHLARTFYGHPGSLPDDFLFSHLTRAGFSTLALSYPCDHPAVNHPVPGMTVAQWAASDAAVVADIIKKERLSPRVIGLGWSLGGRVARNLHMELRERGIDLELFIGLSAAAPIPGFGELRIADIKLAPSGLLDGSSPNSSIFKGRERLLQMVDRVNGRLVVDRDAYAKLYVTNSPINFRGEPERYTDKGLIQDVFASITDQGSLDFANYPICAAIASMSVEDMIHTATDSSIFGMLTAQVLYRRMIKPALQSGMRKADDPTRELDERGIENLCKLMDGVTARLSRRVNGSHLFYVGEIGARATSQHIQDLAAEVAAIKSELAALLA